MASGPAKAVAQASDWEEVQPTDWQEVTAAPPPAQPSMMQRAGEFGKDIAKGLGESAVDLMSTGDEFARKHLPAFMTNRNFGFGAPAYLEHVKQMATPANSTQAVSKGIGDAAQFFIPGGAEEEVAMMAPKALRPLARIATSAMGAGAVNKAQGGDFTTGAAMGAGGQVIGQGLKAMAPAVAEGALNIRKLDRAYGKNGGSIGRAVLDETRGIRPSTIADSAEERLGQLNPQLNAAADRASVKPNQARRLLTAPAKDIPLHSAPDVEGRLSEPVRLTQADRPGRPLLQSPSLSTPMAPGLEAEFPQRLASADTGIRPFEGEAHPGMGQAQYIGEIAVERGGPGMVQGVLRRAAPVGRGSIPSMLPNASASLNPARGVLSNAFGTAARQGERTTAGQLQPMATHLGETIAGEPIPANITPRQLLDLKRGFGNEFIHRWNPETMTGVKGTAAKTYHAMANEFNRVVPEAEGLNTRISNLIPVAKRAASEELNAPTVQRAVHRLAAHTGALTGAGIGGAVGYKEGGVPGAIAGGVTGVLAPELLASPEGQMAAARLLNKVSGLRPAVGTAAQFTRKKAN